MMKYTIQLNDVVTNISGLQLC